MNILFTALTPFYPHCGGVERVADTLCREFIKLGHRVFYLHLVWSKEEYKEYNYPAESVTMLPNSDVNSEQNVEFYNQFIENNKIDVIINHNGLYEGAALFCNVRNKKVKLISVIHNNPLLNYNYLWSELSYLRNNTWIEKIKRIARCCLYFKIKKQRLLSLQKHYAQYDGDNHSELVLLSSRYKESLLQIAPHLSNKLYAIANPNSYNDVSILPKKQKELLFVGRLDNRSKKVNRLLKIWEKIYKEFPDWRLSIVGDGPDRKMLEGYCEKRGLCRIHFYGYTDPKPFYERASILCMTSEYEGFPMVLTEAMQFGCIPIAYDSFEAIKDVILEGVTGSLVLPFKEEDYIVSLRKLMLNTEVRDKMALEANKFVRKFSIDVIIKDWLNLISNVNS